MKTAPVSSSGTQRSPRRGGTFLRLAEKTPIERDRYVDFLRAFSICVVVIGHWLLATVYVDEGRIDGVNALHVIDGLWLATWLLQVMPLFFFVGGFSNLVTLDSLGRKGGDYAQFISSRADRLLRPTAIFLAVWIPIAIGVDLFTGFSDRVQELAFELLGRPLWFLGVYMIMIGLAPAMLKLHRRYGVKALVIMAGAAAAVDVLDLGLGVPMVANLNYLSVWLFAHQLGFFYAEGSLVKLGRKVFAAMALGGLALLTVLTAFGPYSVSMVGLVGERSNTNPPTICILILSVWQVGLAMLLRDPINRFLSKTRNWAVVIALNVMIMTMFLWHQTAVLIVVGLFYPFGFPQPVAGTPQWWAVRPLWVVVLAIVLAGLVAVFARFERGFTLRKRTQTGRVGA